MRALGHCRRKQRARAQPSKKGSRDPWSDRRGGLAAGGHRETKDADAEYSGGRGRRGRGEAGGLPHAAELADRFGRRTATVGVIGLGYVGLPTANLLGSRGFAVLGFDTDGSRIAALNLGRSYIRHVQLDALWASRDEGRFAATTDFARLGEADAVLICVPTPLDGERNPDLGFVRAAAARIAEHLRPGMLVVLESTSYPGTCREVLRPILESSGLRSGEDFFLAYSPEREDPGNLDHATATIPRVVGGDGTIALDLACALYRALVSEVVPAESLEVAEAVKITENVFRAVNIGLVNELKTIYDAMGIDIWHVIAGASSKPFGYMPFHPGPGLGGHCVPVDPFYLAWKARAHGVESRFIELAGETNDGMPRHVAERLGGALQGLAGRHVLLLGVAYKRNIDDVRESPGLRLIKLLEGMGAVVDFHDPFVETLPETADYPTLSGRTSIPWPPDYRRYDAALIVTDHDQTDYAGLVAGCPLVLDTRNACERHGVHAPNVIKV